MNQRSALFVKAFGWRGLTNGKAPTDAAFPLGPTLSGRSVLMPRSARAIRFASDPANQLKITDLSLFERTGVMSSGKFRDIALCWTLSNTRAEWHDHELTLGDH